MAEVVRTSVVIGLEVHVQLATRTKMFSRAPSPAGACAAERPGPNALVDAVVLGLPGALPTPNAEAVEQAIRVGLALGCAIAPEGVTRWDRKSYFYPDLPKGYQLSQLALPVCGPGVFELPAPAAQSGNRGGGGGPVAVDHAAPPRRIRIARAHLEEDAGKLLHEAPGGGALDCSIVDYNRAGTPLLEIVTEPDFRSADEVVLFCQVLRDLCRFIGASRGVLQRGHMRFEPNVNCVLTLGDGREVRTPIVEVKNLNSFRAVRGAIEHEAREQPRRWAETGREHGPGAKETRGWDDRAGVTVPQRGKEDAQDYRYFPDPDLLPVPISAALVGRLRSGLPELPLARRARYRGAWGLNDKDAAALTAEREESDFFESAVASAARLGVAMERAPKGVAVVLLQSGAKRRGGPVAEDDEGGEDGRGGDGPAGSHGSRLISSLGVSADQIAEIVALRDRGEVSAAGADAIFGALTDPARTGASARAVAEELGLLLTRDEGAMDRWADEAIAHNPGAAADVRAGKEAAVGRIVGAAVKLAGGRADAASLREKILARLRSGTGAGG